jgi:GNAT superfamily N-acetyltransferase
VAGRAGRFLAHPRVPALPLGLLEVGRLQACGMSDPAVSIRQVTFAELTSHGNFLDLFREYAAESALAGLPPPDEKMAQYRLIDESGIFYVYAAFIGEDLIGFLAFLLPVLPHYGVTIAVSESFFVAQKSRKGGAGIKLLRAAEDHARRAGSPALMVSAPTGGRLAAILPRLGYRETNRAFLRELAKSA